MRKLVNWYIRHFRWYCIGEFTGSTSYSNELPFALLFMTESGRKKYIQVYHPKGPSDKARIAAAMIRLDVWIKGGNMPKIVPIDQTVIELARKLIDKKTGTS